MYQFKSSCYHERVHLLADIMLYWMTHVCINNKTIKTLFKVTRFPKINKISHCFPEPKEFINQNRSSLPRVFDHHSDRSYFTN
jgi:hypothetical protein